MIANDKSQSLIRHFGLSIAKNTEKGCSNTTILKTFCIFAQRDNIWSV